MSNNEIMNEMYRFYNTNADFKRYIDDCIKTYGGDVYLMFENRIAQEYYKSLLTGGCNAKESNNVESRKSIT